MSEPALILALGEFIEQHKGGSPTDATIFWIHLKPREIAQRFTAESSFEVSNGLVKRVLRTKGFRFRKLSKNLPIGEYKQRDLQFRLIFELVGLMSITSPVISIDCKKKERLGNLYREGKLCCTGQVKVFDHDYHYLGKGTVILHGIYDLQQNEAYVSIGNSHETAPFIIDNLRWWWDNYGIHNYPDAKSVLILCDSGGGNSYRHHVFKKQLLDLASETGMDFIICHYPPYASKWNPIEHRLFCHVHQAMQGVVLSDYELVRTLIAKTKTKQGLNVIVRLNLEKYEIGIRTPKSEVDYLRVNPDPRSPSLIYRIAA